MSCGWEWWLVQGRGGEKKGVGCLNSGILSQAACGRLVLLTNLPQKDKFLDT